MTIIIRSDFTSKDAEKFPYIVSCNNTECHFVVSARDDLEARTTEFKHHRGKMGPCPRRTESKYTPTPLVLLPGGRNDGMGEDLPLVYPSEMPHYAAVRALDPTIKSTIRMAADSGMFDLAALADIYNIPLLFVETLLAEREM